MGKNYIPASHDAFYVWQGNYYDRLSTMLDEFKIEAEKLLPLTTAKEAYEQAFERASNPDASNRSDRLVRNESETAYKKEIRKFNNEFIRYNSNVSDYNKKLLGLTVADDVITPAPMPTTHPVLQIGSSQPQQHTIRIQDEIMASRAKPHGVEYCEIWYKTGDAPPVEDNELIYAGSSSKSNFVIDFPASQSGERVYYKARWVNTRKQYGPWGVLTSSIIS